MRALTGLRLAGTALQSIEGRPPEMPLENIMPDPANPRPPLHLRSPDEQQKQCELNASIKQRGVKSPISLRPHPTTEHTWIINHGHCRYDAARAAGLPTIPYFIDPNFDCYDQVAENLHRCDLSIWAIAAFIARKVADGDAKGLIAAQLGQDSANYVTAHLALIDAPGCLHQAHANGVKSVRTLYDLRRAYDEFPDQVDAWCSSGIGITRDTIKELLEKLRDVPGTDCVSEPASPAFNTPQIAMPHEQSCTARTAESGHVIDSGGQSGAIPKSTPAEPTPYEKPHSPLQSSSPLSGRPIRQELHRNAKTPGNAGSSTPPELCHDINAQDSTTDPNTQKLCHDTKSSDDVIGTIGQELCHDIANPNYADDLVKPELHAVATALTPGMTVEYKGNLAKLISNVMVKIVVAGNDMPFEVPLFDLKWLGNPQWDVPD